MALKCLTILCKNFKTYTRIDIIIYLLLPMLMLHLVWMRCRQNGENPSHCFIRSDGMLGNNVKLNSLYNTMESVAEMSPEKVLLLYSNEDSITASLASALKNALKLRNVLEVESESDLEEKLFNGNYLGGIGWKSNKDYRNVTIRFPSTLRSAPIEVWETDKIKSETIETTSYYKNEGFVQIIYAITAFLNNKDISKVAQVYKDSKVRILSRPFIFDKANKKDFYEKLQDPIKELGENVLPFYLGILYIYPFVRLVMYMQTEKTKQLNDLMNIAGANRFFHYLCWFVSSLIVLSVINVLTVFVLKAPICNNGNILNCSSFTALLLFFSIWSVSGICFCFLLNSLLQKVILSAFVVAFFCILGYLLYIFLKPTVLILRYVLYILFQYAFLVGLGEIIHSEAESDGLRMNSITHTGNLFKASNEGNLPHNFVDIPIIMLIVAAASLILCLFIELCFPGRYGVSKLRTSHSKKGYDHPAVVQAHMINKWQKNKMPLKNFTMNMYDDQITTILGLSDSGKSAAANSISGSSPGNSGWVKVDDYDIIKRHSAARSSLGLSPQHRPLFGSLTVKEHLDFFSSLRGGPKRGVSKKRSTQKYLKALDLDNVASVKARNLSDSDRKRLSVACAFCGDPRIIILDEPTEGLEPSERRLMWDFLQSEKRCRTIIVTTYHIEEADFLADRVAILCDGQIIFNGTSVFLRNSYGSGYQLVCSQGQISVEPIITNMVLKHIPDTSSSGDRPCEVSYNIPQTSCRSIVPLLRELEGSEHSYNMEAIQIGTTPIIEKFVNATTPACNGFSKCNLMSNTSAPDECLLRGCRLCCNQWKAMCLKKVYHTKHNCLFFFPLLLTLLMAAAGLLTRFKSLPVPLKYRDENSRNFVSQEPFLLDLKSYGSNCSYAFVTKKSEKERHSLVSALQQKSSCHLDYIREEDLNKNRESYNEKYILALQINKCEILTYYSTKWLHSEAVCAAIMGKFANADVLNRACTDEKIEIPKKSIDFYNHPYRSIQYNVNSTVLQVECFESGAFYLLFLVLSIFSGFFAASIIRERVIGFKLLQQVEGLNMATFWLSHLLWDWMWLSILSILLLIIMYLIMDKEFNDETVGYAYALILFNLAQLPFLYLLMQLFKRKIFGWIIPILLLFLMAIPFVLAAPDVPFGVFYLVPIYTAIALVHSICIHKSSYEVCKGRNDKRYGGCETHPHTTCIWAGLPYIVILIVLAMLYFLLLLLYEKGLGKNKRLISGQNRGSESGCTSDRMTRNEQRNHSLILDKVTKRHSRTPIRDISVMLKP
ncbi:uncharacterized protein Dana_GF25113, isoform F [Drosophila ananassae]|nr:phospholipid-transporting ATPase ABCA3 isoform X3 [Drosophila ananassae]KPU77840.1 uncharacterized protein Dana_GF25113, isoform F [Drosophila ananassae]